MKRNDAISLLMQVGARSLAQEYIEESENQEGEEYWEQFDAQEELLDDFDNYIKECMNDVDVCNSVGEQLPGEPMKIGVNVGNRGISAEAAKEMIGNKVYDRTNQEEDDEAAKVVGVVDGVVEYDGIVQSLTVKITSEEFREKLLSGEMVSYAVEGDESE